MELKDKVLDLDINLSDAQLNKFEEYYKFLVEYNEKVNLTAITEHDEVMIKHFYDSLILSRALYPGKIKLLDVGAGAGFPSVPNAIINDMLDVTIIDSLNKRIVFLEELIKKLGLKNVKPIHGRAEEYAIENREKFDVVTARAVARLNILIELCIPFVKVGGLFVAMKSKEGEEELNEALNGIGLLGGKVIDRMDFELPNGMGERELILIKKIKPTPNKYPRKFAQIKSKPLK